MGELDRLLSSGEEVLRRSRPVWRAWGLYVVLALGAVIFSAGLKVATPWLVAEAGWPGLEKVLDVSFAMAIAVAVTFVFAAGSPPSLYLLTSARVLYRPRPLGRTFEILRSDIGAVTLYKGLNTLVLGGRDAGAVRLRRGATTVPAPKYGGVLHLYRVDKPKTFAADLGVPIAVAMSKRLDRNTQRMWRVCMLAGVIAFIVVMAGGLSAAGPVCDSIIGTDVPSTRARNLKITFLYLLVLIAASGLAFYAARILPLAVARRSLSVRHVQQVIYGEALESFGMGERLPGNGRIKARILWASMPLGILSALFGQPLGLDAAGLKALYETLPPAAKYR